MKMDRKRVVILIIVFASSHCAAYASTKVIKYVQQAVHLVKLLYTSNCTGTEINLVLLKNFSIYLLFLIRCLFEWLDLRKILLHQVCDGAVYLYEIVENINCFIWNGLLFINSEVHYNLCYLFGVQLPIFLANISSSVHDIVDSRCSGLGSFVVVLMIFILCSLLYFTFLITLVIVRLYKLFLKPLIKMLTVLLNYRRRFVLRSRRL